MRPQLKHLHLPQRHRDSIADYSPLQAQSAISIDNYCGAFDRTSLAIRNTQKSRTPLGTARKRSSTPISTYL
uniref:Uncharacterized protein n=1 Tax=Heterorhabditis bacteriophora TaxID=37862 RepID=A0A1I7WET9_HETBA